MSDLQKYIDKRKSKSIKFSKNWRLLKRIHCQKIKH